ncbi:unnamed protein product [Triticum turgidum subsp. durum]|uniref:Protein kinase domain-containing protein n=1 Tax=Triticum turgidum subsp. durum TaxID=4567 RepID=A0A9R0SC44_TRITD|nr:unnamed protein product [Triticum turgidum subsp. durum]
MSGLRICSFISIDCGYTANQTYTDSRTGISYASDEGYIDAGLIHPVDKSNLQTDLADRYLNLCFFPSGERNCYTLRFFTLGGKYLVRAAFGYGDYDKLNKNPTFDLYFGVNYWTTVTIVSSSTAYVFEIIAVCPADFLQICLVNKGSGTPFISGLDLRSLTSDLYLEANVTQSLVLLSFFRDTVGFGPNRYHFGTNYQHIRFPDDPYDRMWQRYENVDGWTDVPNKSNGEIKNSTNDNYDAPSAVMRSASTPVNDSRMDLSWSSDSSMNVGVDPKFFLVLYFAELEAVQELRQFDVSVDNNPLASAFSPKFLLPTVLSGIVQGSNEHSVSLVATSNLALQPLINAMEIYMVRPVNESNSLDGFVNAINGHVSVTNRLFGQANAMMTIQEKFSVKKNWGLVEQQPQWINSLESARKNSAWAFDFKLRYNLSPISILFCRVDNNPGLCGNNTCNPIQKKRRNKTKLLQIVISVIVAVSLLVLAVFLFVIWDRRKKRPDLAHSTNTFENRRFTYKELKHITNNFNSVIGRGGFGLVYVGCLENGALVAVKMRSETSSQGNTEFLAEAQHLARVHHKNLVSLIGYCKDKKHLSLVYEYMDEGNLEDRLRVFRRKKRTFRCSEVITFDIKQMIQAQGYS